MATKPPYQAVSQSPNQQVELDLNNPIFQGQLFNLDKTERNHVLNTLKKLRQLNWEQVYRDQGLKWEKITSVVSPVKGEVIYSLRITQSRRATATRVGNFICFKTVQPDHDSTYGKK